MKRKRGVETCKHGVKVDIRRDFAGRPLGNIKHGYECAINQFKGPKLPEYCKSACPKYEPREAEPASTGEGETPGET